MTGKHIDVSDLADHRLRVAQIIQETFWPWPPTRWLTMSESQQQEFLDCTDEILTYLRRYGWKP